ncbi:hypothetical protein [Flavobacterium sp. UBA4197]|uniref:hypothetical protein n=1 Tax=Flavobacterium sp. UBA4197 TaxID=1946546 RepID=UPI00257FC90E|nr:hypothetical protein [Flavobacterium sp. UBA4197]HRB72441.1 hypothetical protein [Flavobacterium sp.]
MAKSYLNQAGMPLGLKNNNPGNLRLTSVAWDGKIPNHLNNGAGFEQFYELRFGVRALMRQLITDMKRGLTTVELIINKFSPPHENNTAAYIKTVSKMTGFGASQPITVLNKSTLLSLCKAIVSVEIGSNYANYVTAQDYEDAFSILGVSLANIQLPAPKKKI